MQAITISYVTQLVVLEEFSLLILIAEKSLIAYHLDAVCPVGGGPSGNDSAKRAPQKLSGTREVGFFATGRMKDRTLVFYKKREGLSSTFKVRSTVVCPHSLRYQSGACSSTVRPWPFVFSSIRLSRVCSSCLLVFTIRHA